MTAYQKRQQSFLSPGLKDERQITAHGIIRQMLIQFNKEWGALQDQERDEAWLGSANALLDHYSHQLYDIVHDIKPVVTDDFATEIQCLSADMIKTTNILIMIGCKDECRERGSTLAAEALRRAEWCVIGRTTKHARKAEGQ